MHQRLHTRQQKKKLKGTYYRIDEDFNFDTRQARKQLLPYMQDARIKGHRASLRRDKLMVDGKIFDLDFCTTNFTLRQNEKRHHHRTRSASPPTRTRTDPTSNNNSNTASYFNTQRRTRRTTSLESPSRQLYPHSGPEAITFVTATEKHDPQPNTSIWQKPVLYTQHNNQEDIIQQQSPSQHRLPSLPRIGLHHLNRTHPREEQTPPPTAEILSPDQHQDSQHNMGKTFLQRKDCDIYKRDRLNHNYSLPTNVKTYPKAGPSNDL